MSRKATGLRSSSFPCSSLEMPLSWKLLLLLRVAQWLCLLAVFLFFPGCKKAAAPSHNPPPSPTSQVSYEKNGKNEAPQPAYNLATLPLDGSIALARATTICALGSRAYATPGYRQTLAYLRAELTRLGWKTIYQAFDIPTPLGPRTYTNLIATWPTDIPANDRLLLTAHYDSPGSPIGTFPAASSGAAGCGILLEIAERLSAKNIPPTLAGRIQLLFLDGEEPTRQISADDGLYGSRFFLHSLSENGQIENYRALLAFGAVGHKNARWTLPTLTNPVLNTALQTFAERQKWENQILPLNRPSWGPHLPALQSGLPATFLNDALDPALGTADDTPDRLDAESLRRAAIAALQLLELPTKTN